MSKVNRRGEQQQKLLLYQHLFSVNFWCQNLRQGENTRKAFHIKGNIQQPSQFFVWPSIDNSCNGKLLYACERSLASHAVYTLIQCTPTLVEKAGVAPVVTFRITARKQERMQARYPLWIWNPWGRTHKVQNRSNQWLHKMDLGPNTIKKKKNYCVVQTLPWLASTLNST